MYLKRLTLKNIKCFADATLSLPGEGGYAGWNVLLGVNSTGKSTVLQAAALALLGPVSGGRLLQQPASWVRQGQPFGEIEAEIAQNANSRSSRCLQRSEIASTPAPTPVALVGSRRAMGRSGGSPGAAAKRT